MASSHPLGLARFAAVAAATLPSAIFVASVVLGACTSPIQTPAQIGDCKASADVTCTISSPSGGIELPVDGGSVEDSGEIISESLDGAICGTIDTLVVADCGSCIEQNCCMSDSLCSRDTNGCELELQCATFGTTCPALSPASQTNYNDLLQCLNLYCPSECFTVTNRDL
jgi:hypothetical protein